MGGFSDGLAKIKIDGKWGFVDETGTLIIENLEVDWVEDFYGGLACTIHDSKLGAIDKTGEMVFPCEFHTLYIMPEGPVLVRRDGEDYGFLSRTGDMIIPEKFDSVGLFSEGLAEVEKDGKIYFINADGETIFRMPVELATIRAYYTPTYFNDGLLRVQFSAPVRSNAEDPQYGYLDKNGEIVLTLPKECQFALDFHEGLALVGFEDGRQCFINKVGEVLITLPEGATFVDRFQEGHAVYYVEDESGDLIPHVIKNPLIPFADTDNQGEMYDIILMQEDGCINAMRATYFTCIWLYLVIRFL